eukprot:5644275-Prymnesium_polylepis.2
MPPRSGRETSARTVCVHQKVRTPYLSEPFEGASHSALTPRRAPSSTPNNAISHPVNSARLRYKTDETRADDCIDRQRAHARPGVVVPEIHHHARAAPRARPDANQEGVTAQRSCSAACARSGCRAHRTSWTCGANDTALLVGAHGKRGAAKHSNGRRRRAAAGGVRRRTGVSSTSALHMNCTLTRTAKRPRRSGRRISHAHTPKLSATRPAIATTLSQTERSCRSQSACESMYARKAMSTASTACSHHRGDGSTVTTHG